MGVTSQSRASHHNNMKVFVVLAGLVAVTSAYPMFLLDDADAAYAPVYRVPRQIQLADDFQSPPVIRPSRFAEAARRRIQEEDDLETAADAAYGAAPVGRVKIQTYRGPSKGDYDFAPWGYYNTQPADLQIHHQGQTQTTTQSFIHSITPL